MSKSKSSPTISRILTQALETIRVNFERVKVKQGKQVPHIKIKNGKNKEKIYPLAGEHYTIGRSSSCDISIKNAVVSQHHCSLTRNPKKNRSFIVKDEQSTNGVYRGKKRFTSFAIYNGESFTLSPPELADSVKITYSNPVPFWMKWIRYSLYGTGGLFGFLLLFVLMEWSKIDVYPLPIESKRPITVRDRNRQTINPIRNQTYRELNLNQFSPYLPKAVVASEDSRYYWHLGVDPYGIARAIYINTLTRKSQQGASTISQQLARSLFTQVGTQATFRRKFREMLTASKLEAVYSKNDILEAYLNRVYLGIGLYGFEDTARFYFDKSAKDLTLSEAATLVAILPAPNAYNPVKNYDKALKNRNLVIDRMLKLGMVTEEEADRARRTPIEVSPKARNSLSSSIAPYFYDLVLDELEAILGTEVASEGNFIIETALNPELQKTAQLSLEKAIAEDGSRFKFSQGALVTIDSSTGEIVALVGGVDYNNNQFNRATNAKRQPGSTFKIFAYTAAIAFGINPNKEYSCSPLSWLGQKYKACERSPGKDNIDMYNGLSMSENAIALRVAQDVGLDKTIELSQKMGIESPLTQAPGLVLGQSEVTVLEITGAYGTLANRGIWHRPHAIKRILDGGDCTNPNIIDTCRQIYSRERTTENYRQAISPNVARKMTRMLKKVITEGTGKAAKLGEGEAGKTGTTDRNVDLWFIGYVPKENLVTGIWLGNDDNKPTMGSSWQAATLWGKYMKEFVD